MLRYNISVDQFLLDTPPEKNTQRRQLDYIRILECPFSRPEYTIGIPGLINGKRILFSINEEACDALQIIDETRCFVFLFSKIDGMGLCDTYSFTDNKKRILSVVAENQADFDITSSQLYFYSKEIRTEVVHKGKKIDELVSLRKVQDINQQLFSIIIKFCTKIIDSGITSIGSLKEYILNEVSKYEYKTPQEELLAALPAVYYQRTTYVAIY